MSMIAQYNTAIMEGFIEDDPCQRDLLSHFERLRLDLIKPQRLFDRFRKKTIKGIYLYGAVGSGKTFLMDLFFEQISISQKMRFHFHHFMQQIDEQLRHLQGHKNPLQLIATQLASSTRLLCFDEFMVDDVAYAMILAELLQAIFSKGMVLVATSNTQPDDLYLKGVQRARFLPAIVAIKSSCEILNLTNQTDYRLSRDIRLHTYLFPLGKETDKRFLDQFNSVAPRAKNSGFLTIQNREISYIKKSDKAVWFDFRVICNLPRSQLDYLEIAHQFEIVFVSNIPILGENDTLLAILFMHFIDVMYDEGIQVVLSAAGPISGLCLNSEMAFHFKRTSSRLEEMQSIDYLKRHPRRKLHHF